MQQQFSLSIEVYSRHTVLMLVTPERVLSHLSTLFKKIRWYKGQLHYSNDLGVNSVY